MDALRLMLVLVAATLPWIAKAANGSDPAGTTTLNLENKANSRKVTSQLWFEAAPGSNAQPFTFKPRLWSRSDSPRCRPGSALGEATVDRPVPMGILERDSSEGCLAVELVRAGYVVLSDLASWNGGGRSDRSRPFSPVASLDRRHIRLK